MMYVFANIDANFVIIKVLNYSILLLKSHGFILLLLNVPYSLMQAE